MCMCLESYTWRAHIFVVCTFVCTDLSVQTWCAHLFILILVCRLGVHMYFSLLTWCAHVF